jgi:peptidoglycan/xylan/chitin deacetylase (PgdA/CDA1 family)
MAKPACSLALDLDNQWSYMKTHGDPGWEAFPSYLDVVVPRVLDVLGQWGWTITVFVVGQDAAVERNQKALCALAAAGHEMGNHSFRHEPWLHLYSESEIQQEIARGEEAIEAATGRKPQGFRGPGYSLSGSTLRVLARRGYVYDASTLPTFLGPLARMYYFLTSHLKDDEKAQRKALFGSLRDGLRPVRPYRWQIENGQLLEIPVTTMPLFKLPFHFSYLLYISTFSAALAMLYFKTALLMCRITGTEPSLLLHPLDFLGCEDVPELAFFPAMKLDITRKLELLNRVLRNLHARYTVSSLGEQARKLQKDSSLAVYSPGELNLKA